MKNIKLFFITLWSAYANRVNPEDSQMLIRLMWGLGSSLSIIGVIVSIVAGVVLLFEVFGILTPGFEVAEPKGQLLNKMQLEKTLSVFERKLRDYQAIPTATSTYPDPSR
ncbi:MAG: hypothetical protein RIQ56_811 [Candidatus Parcubacteria bacterium]|jgi:hypothetical protein